MDIASYHYGREFLARSGIYFLKRGLVLAESSCHGVAPAQRILALWEVDFFSFLYPEFAAGICITCSGKSYPRKSYPRKSLPHSHNGLGCSEIVVILIYDADFVPAIHLPFAIMYKDSALFADDLRNPFFMLTKSCLSILLLRCSLVHMEFNEASMSKAEPFDKGS